MSRPRISRVKIIVPAVRRTAANRIINRAFPLLSRFDLDTGSTLDRDPRQARPPPPACGYIAGSPRPPESAPAPRPCTSRAIPQSQGGLQPLLSPSPARIDPESPCPKDRPPASLESSSCFPSTSGTDTAPCGRPCLFCSRTDTAVSRQRDSPPGSPVPPPSGQSPPQRRGSGQ